MNMNIQCPILKLFWMISFIVLFLQTHNIKSTNVREDLYKMVKWQSKLVGLQHSQMYLEGF